MTDAENSDTSTRTVGLRPVLVGALALAVAAAVVAGWFGITWILAGNDDSLKRAQTRDEVDRVARTAIDTFNTLDYQKVDEGLDNWLNASTGPLHDDVAGRRNSSKQTIEGAKTKTDAEVLSLAVTDLNEFDGKATVIAAVKVVVAIDNKEPVPKYLRVQATLERVGESGWKLSGLGPVNMSTG
jgi:Mce-associated membrane protein